MAPPTALITGGSSGMGLALTKHLLALSWHVAIVDINPPPEILEGTKFIETDVTSWDSQATAFSQAYAWNGRLDYAGLNAGILDRDDIFLTLSKDPAKPPSKPNMRTYDVNLNAVYYGVKLAAHYMTLDSSSAGKHRTGGKIVVTASSAGLWSMVSAPMYCSTKYGVVGLVRALGGAPDGARSHNISINAICPGFVATSLINKEVWDNMPKASLTSMDLIIEAFDQLALFKNIEQADWVEQGPTAQTLLAIDNILMPIEPPPFELRDLGSFYAGAQMVNTAVKRDNVKHAESDEKTSQT